VIYADADFAGDMVELRSTSKMVVQDWYGATIVWKSTKQLITMKSTTNVEFIATMMAMEHIWVSNLEREFHHEQDCDPYPIPVYNDNMAYIANINSGAYQPQSQYVGVRYFWIKDLIRFDKATVSHIPSD